MRILYNSRLARYKTPFGTLTPGQSCTLHIWIPASCQTRQVLCRMVHEDGRPAFQAAMSLERSDGPYEVYAGSFSFSEPGLFFYDFGITTVNESFSLLRQGEDTNMEAGDRWQISCIPEDFNVPDWAVGTVMYQIFPDRFRRSGRCDLTGKLTPYSIHDSWNEEVSWQPTPEGRILNNDFFGGNFRGIQEKLPYLQAQGIRLLYLNPICKAFSSHRYDTCDYKTPDPMLGTEEDFRMLCNQAHRLGIRILLDGVFSHTGSDSVYFDKNRRFGGGAWSDPDSPYRSWYQFRHYPDDYVCWWNFDTLPCVRKLEPGFLDYVIDAEDSVVAHWLRLGADGFRLDVADELPDAFILRLRRRMRALKPDALLVGEVWEDASNKIAYGKRRQYFTGGELDSVMNYPLRKAILEFARGWDDGVNLRETALTLAENYPPQVLHCLMNSLGTHDTPRVLTALVDDFDGTRAEKAARHLSSEQRREALELLRLASFLQFTLPGAPCVYYGDEAGMEGFADPFNRRPYPWGQEDAALTEHYRRLGRLRGSHPALRAGTVAFLQAANGHLAFTRSIAAERLLCCVNRDSRDWALPAGKLLFGRGCCPVSVSEMTLRPLGFALLEVNE